MLCAIFVNTKSLSLSLIYYTSKAQMPQIRNRGAFATTIRVLRQYDENLIWLKKCRLIQIRLWICPCEIIRTMHYTLMFIMGGN